jgi:FKBP-type peptidyl-prolyl cis-trans isomerase
MKSAWWKRGALAIALPLALAGCQQQPESKPQPTTPPPTTAPQPAKPEAPKPAAQPTQEAPKVTESEAVQAARKLGTPSDQPVVKTASGLEYIDVKVGTGEAAKARDQVKVHYTGWLVNGSKFDSSVDRGQPFSFSLGVGQVIRGWDEGVAGMKPGGVRKLIIPSALGYGDRGAGGAIPPGATLIFEVSYFGKS